MVYTDPFYAECRAYGRIQEQADQGEVREKVATKCHGYMFLDEEAQRWLEGEGIDLGAESLTDELLPIIGKAAGVFYPPFRPVSETRIHLRAYSTLSMPASPRNTEQFLLLVDIIDSSVICRRSRASSCNCERIRNCRPRPRRANATTDTKKLQEYKVTKPDGNL